MSNRIEDLHPDVQPKVRLLLERAAAEGIVLGVTDTLRTNDDQLELWAKGRTAPGPMCHHSGERHPRQIGTCGKHPMGLVVTHAGPGQSWHNFGRAADLKITTFAGDTTPKDVYDGPWERVGQIAEECGLEWGGRWTPKKRDMPHVQDRGGMTLAQARETHG